MIVYAMDKNMYVRACPWTVRGVNGALKTLIKSVVRDTKGPCPWISAIFASTGRKKVNEINTRLRHGHCQPPTGAIGVSASPVSGLLPRGSDGA